MRRILVHRRMPVNAVTRGFTAPRNDQLIPARVPSKNPLITKSEMIRRVVLAWWAHSTSPAPEASRTYCRQPVPYWIMEGWPVTRTLPPLLAVPIPGET